MFLIYAIYSKFFFKDNRNFRGWKYLRYFFVIR